MPRTSKAEAPVVVENEVLTSRHVELDEFTVVFESYHVDADGAPVFKGLPDDRCQCPHWGIVVTGELRLRYADGQDTYRRGPARSEPRHRGGDPGGRLARRDPGLAGGRRAGAVRRHGVGERRPRPSRLTPWPPRGRQHDAD